MATFIDGQPDSGVVLVGVDFSELSDGALRTAAGVASRGPGFELHVVHVLPSRAGAALQDSAHPGALYDSTKHSTVGHVEMTDDVTAKLTELAAQAAPSVKQVTIHVRVGSPDVQIAQLASDLGADLIVVGTHGRQGLVRFILGSVAESLVRNAPCPVLTYRPRATTPWEQIQPPCVECLDVQRNTHRARLWCDRHSQHHGRAHTYSLVPDSYGIGSQTLRQS
jgi:nucleotide-binding universal stress UspA family protein